MPGAEQPFVFHAECSLNVPYNCYDYTMTFFPNDKTMSVVHRKNNRPLLKRGIYVDSRDLGCQPITVAAVRLGASVEIMQHKFKVIEYGDDYTRKAVEAMGAPKDYEALRVKAMKDYEAVMAAEKSGMDWRVLPVGGQPDSSRPKWHGLAGCVPFDREGYSGGHRPEAVPRTNEELAAQQMSDERYYHGEAMRPGRWKHLQNADGGIDWHERFDFLGHDNNFRRFAYSQIPAKTPGRLNHIVAGDPCIVSFPGRHCEYWNTVLASGFQYACVWTGESCADCNHLARGGNDSNPFDNICPSCQRGWLKSWKDNVRNAVNQRAHLQAIVFEKRWGHMQKAELKWLQEELIPVTCYNEFGEKVNNPYPARR